MPKQNIFKNNAGHPSRGSLTVFLVLASTFISLVATTLLTANFFQSPGQRTSTAGRAAETVSGLSPSRILLLNQQETSANSTPSSKQIKVFEIIFNPIIDPPIVSQPTRLTQVVYGKKEIWNDPIFLDRDFIFETQAASHGFINFLNPNTSPALPASYRLIIDGFPPRYDGSIYTEQRYLNCINDVTQCLPDGGSGVTADYKKIISDYDLCGRLNRGEIDEVWLWGGPYFGFEETNSTGIGAFDSPVITGTSCQKVLPIMGFSYEARSHSSSGYLLISEKNSTYFIR